MRAGYSNLKFTNDVVEKLAELLPGARQFFLFDFLLFFQVNVALSQNLQPDIYSS